MGNHTQETATQTDRLRKYAAISLYWLTNRSWEWGRYACSPGAYGAARADHPTCRSRTTRISDERLLRDDWKAIRRRG